MLKAGNRIGRPGAANKKFNLEKFAANNGLGIWEVIYSAASNMDLNPADNKIIDAIVTTTSAPGFFFDANFAFTGDNFFIIKKRASNNVLARAGDGVIRYGLGETIALTNPTTVSGASAEVETQGDFTDNFTCDDPGAVAASLSQSQKVFKVTGDPGNAFKAFGFEYNIRMYWDKDAAVGSYCSGSGIYVLNILIPPAAFKDLNESAYITGSRIL